MPKGPFRIQSALIRSRSGMLLGIAKPFEMYGSTSDYAEQGVR